MTQPATGREPDLLTITEAAELVRAPVATLRYWNTWAPARAASGWAAGSSTAATTSTTGSRSSAPRPSTAGDQPSTDAPVYPQDDRTALTQGPVVGTVA